MPRGTHVLVLLAASSVLMGFVSRRPRAGCPPGMAAIGGGYCIDRYEASLIEVVGRSRTRPWSPYETPAGGHRYRACSKRGVVPQGYISQVRARAACRAAGKRLCSDEEWVRACKGPQETLYPYGDVYARGRCNDGRPNPVRRLYAMHPFTFEHMNDPRLNRLPGTVARAGQFVRCSNRYGVHDMMGNLHEWVDTVRGGHGIFRGGYFADVHINGEGCEYATHAHIPTYHDYSTGFRCCADHVR